MWLLRHCFSALCGFQVVDKCLLGIPLYVVARVLWVVSRGLSCG